MLKIKKKVTKTDLKEMEWENVYWTHLTQD
jgi:hypothetical protein